MSIGKEIEVEKREAEGSKISKELIELGSQNGNTLKKAEIVIVDLCRANKASIHYRLVDVERACRPHF